jgi:hypothetical protein
VSEPTDEPGAVVWCALCPTWAKTQVLLDGHVVRRHPDATGGYSTSAKLRHVEQERDDLLTEVLDLRILADSMPCGWCNGVGVAPAERFGRDADGAPNVDEDRPCPEGCEVAGWLQAERNDAADVERERDEALAVRASAIDAFINLNDQLTLTKAELATARTELKLLRAAMDASLNRRAD